MNNLPFEMAVRLARAGSAVERCHAHQNLLRYTVGQHSLDMVTLLTLAWLEEYGTLPRAELLVAAAFHDVPERIVGDIPLPSKRMLGPEVHALEDGILRSMGVAVQLTEEEQRWLKLADGIELMLWSHEESVTRGNRAFGSWVRYYLKKFGDELNNIPKALRKVIDLARYSEHRDLNEDYILREGLKNVDHV